MAEYRVSVADRTYDVSIQKDGLFINGDQFAYHMESLNGNGLHILRQANRNVEAYVESSQGGLYDIQIAGNHLSAEVVSGFHSVNISPKHQLGKIFAPMPGLIVDILVKPGDLVKTGDTLLIQEAMKMQMKLKAPCNGIVTGITTSSGAQIEKGVLLVSIDPAC